MISGYKHEFTSRVESSVDPEKPANLDLHCFETQYIVYTVYYSEIISYTLS